MTKLKIKINKMNKNKIKSQYDLNNKNIYILHSNK